VRGCMPGRGGFLSSLPHQTFPDELSNPNKIPLTISEKPSYRDLAEQALYIYEMFGPDILAIGTDFFGLLNVEEPEGLRDITGVANLFAELRDRGLGDRDIDRISHLNALRVIRENSARWR